MGRPHASTATAHQMARSVLPSHPRRDKASAHMPTLQASANIRARVNETVCSAKIAIAAERCA